eukprot:1141208-Pelagomonas_calceolata.AAC.5
MSGTSMICSVLQFSAPLAMVINCSSLHDMSSRRNSFEGIPLKERKKIKIESCTRVGKKNLEVFLPDREELPIGRALPWVATGWQLQTAQENTLPPLTKLLNRER